MEHSIKGPRVILEQITREIIDEYLAQFSQTIQSALHVEDVQSEREYILSRCDRGAFFYTIADRMRNTIIGAIEIRNPGHVSQLYCWINEQFWGRHFFSQAFRLLVQEYKKQTGQHTISACVGENNGRSIAALQSVGFQKKGTRNGPHGVQIIMQLHIDDIL